MKIRKFLITFIFVILMVVSFRISVDALDKTVWNDANTYNYTSNVVEERELANGTTFINDTGFSTRGNLQVEQDVYMLFQKSNSAEGMKVVTWAMYDENHNIASAYTRGTLATIAKDYEEKHPGWKVVGGINADQYFFNYGTKLHADGSDLFVGQPYYAMRGDGENWFSIDAMGRAGCNVTGFKNDGSTNPLVYETGYSTRFVLKVYNENKELQATYPIDGLNPDSKLGDNYVYIHALYNDQTEGQVNQNTVIKSKEVSSENDMYIVSHADKAYVSNARQYAWYKDTGAVDAFFGKGSIDKVAKSVTLNATSFAIDTNNSQLLSLLKEGCYVVAEQELGHMVNGQFVVGDIQDCESAIGWHTLQRLNGVDNNVSNSYNTRGYPRSVFGIQEDGTIVLIAAEGTTKSGMYAEEINALCKAYGIHTAFQMDGGGSVTMIIREDNGKFKTVNEPSDGSDRSVFNGLFFVVKDIESEISVSETTDSSLKFNVNVTNYNVSGNVTNTYVNLIGKTKAGQDYNETKEVVDNVVTFDNLAPNSNYTYNIQFQIEGKTGLNKALSKGTVYTAKRLPVLGQIRLSYEGEGLKANFTLTDADKAIGGFISISFDGGKTFVFAENNSALIESFDGDPIGDIIIKYKYDLKDGKGTQSVETSDVNLKYSYILFLDSLVYNHNEAFSKCFIN